MQKKRVGFLLLGVIGLVGTFILTTYFTVRILMVKPNEAPPSKCGPKAGSRSLSAKEVACDFPLNSRDRKNSSSTRHFIVGGERAGLDQFPWLVLLVVGKKVCGSTLIDDRHLLTAAHCIARLGKDDVGFSLNINKVQAFAGCTSYSFTRRTAEGVLLNEDAPRLKVDAAYVHSGYVKGVLKNDVALLRLSRPVAFVDWLRPVCLAGPDEELPEDCIAAGLGATSVGNDSVLSLLMTVRFVNLKAFDFQDCLQLLSPTIDIKGSGEPSFISDTAICTAVGPRHEDVCFGDSGGPLVCRRKRAAGGHGGLEPLQQYGVVSFGLRGCGLLGQATFYSRVSAYRGWIRHVAVPILSDPAESRRELRFTKRHCRRILHLEPSQDGPCTKLATYVYCRHRQSSPQSHSPGCINVVDGSPFYSRRDTLEKLTNCFRAPFVNLC